MSAVPSGPERRRHLDAAANPAPGRDYLVSLQGTMREGRAVSVAYVPDRAVVAPESFARYLAALEAMPWQTLEQLGAAMLDDVANALVPRWVRVELAADGSGGLRHRVRLEERQPQWRNDALVNGA